MLLLYNYSIADNDLYNCQRDTEYSLQLVLSLGSGDDFLHIEVKVGLSLLVISSTLEVRGQPRYGDGWS